MATVRRDIYVGAPGSAPKRISLDDLEHVVAAVRTAADALADDLGISPQERAPVELVDLLDGSSGLVLEQVVPETSSYAPLAILADCVAMTARGERLPEFLTVLGREAVQRTAQAFAELGGRGRPVRVRRHADPVMVRFLETFGIAEPQGEVLSEAAVRARWSLETPIPAVLPSFEDAAPEVPAAAPDSGASWLVTDSGKVERLDEGMKRLTLRIGGRLVGPMQLDDEHFRAVDSDEARWQNVVVRARSSVPYLDKSSEVLDVTPLDGEMVRVVEPESERAAVVAPVLKKLDALAELQAGWDGHEGRPIRPEVLRDARKFLVALSMTDGLRAPFAAPISSGQVQFEWEGHGRYLELVFEGGGLISAFRVVGADEIDDPVINRARAMDLVRWFSVGR